MTLAEGPVWLGTTIGVIQVVIGFSIIIFVHELGHFLAAKWVGVRVDRFAIGFGARLFGWRSGQGLTLGKCPNYTADELSEKGWGETDYCLKVLPLGGYVKMLGQEDIQVNDKTGEIKMSDDPRAFTNKPVGQRMIVVSAGVIFNLLFAIVGFAGVYMVGKRVVAPEIGDVAVVSPAAQAGLRSGDLVTEANGKPVRSFRDIQLAMILAKKPKNVKHAELRLRVKRDGELLPDELLMQLDQNDNLLETSGLMPAGETILGADAPPVGDLPAAKAGDRITHVAGEPVTNMSAVILAINRRVAETGNPIVELTVERPDPDNLQESTTLKCYFSAALLVNPADMRGSLEEQIDTQHILGLFQRRKVNRVIPGKPGERDGLELGDVIVRWDTILSPLYHEVVASIQSSPGRETPVVLRRGGQIVELKVTPQRPFSLFSSPPAKIGVGFTIGEGQLPIVADTAPGTPAAELNLPRGSQILAIDGQPTENWFDVVRELNACAGRTVTVRYRSGTLEAEGHMNVPSSVVNELDLPPNATIVSINGQTQATLDNGKAVRLPNSAAVRALLEQHAGKTVEIGYRRSAEDPQVYKAQFAVRTDGSNADPWQMRIIYGLSSALGFDPKDETVVERNPLRAAWLGVRQTRDVLLEVYVILKSITTNLASGRTGTARYVSGPVGIVSMAIDRAKQGFPELVFFLAFLSVNLAVINFIPFPVVDGGLMVFLVIEKVKGSPLNLKTQMWATLIGLVTIVLVFLLITFQDVSKLFN